MNSNNENINCTSFKLCRMARLISFVLIVFLVSSLLSACSFKDITSKLPNPFKHKADERIVLVRDGVFEDYPEYTLGKVLEDISKKGEWKAYKLNTGSDIVVYSGELKSTKEKIRIEYKLDEEDVWPISMQVGDEKIDDEDLTNLSYWTMIKKYMDGGAKSKDLEEYFKNIYGFEEALSKAGISTIEDIFGNDLKENTTEESTTKENTTEESTIEKTVVDESVLGTYFQPTTGEEAEGGSYITIKYSDEINSYIATMGAGYSGIGFEYTELDDYYPLKKKLDGTWYLYNNNGEELTSFIFTDQNHIEIQSQSSELVDKLGWTVIVGTYERVED